MKLSRCITLTVLAGVLVLILSACGTRTRPDEDAAIARAPTVALPTATPQRIATSTVAPSATPRPTASRTPTATPTNTPTAAPTATATATPPNPLSIAYMREQAYPGSDIVVEQKLQAGANYQRYRTSYLSEGLKQYALLTVPNGTPPATGWPAIIFNHGYIPPEQYRTTERYVAYVDGFARNGYIVFRPDYRGHDQSEGNASGGYGSPDYTIDVLNATASLKRYPAADPNRIGMWGHSMGGHITLRSMVTTQDIKAGVIWAGVVASYPDLMSRWRRPVPASVPTRGGAGATILWRSTAHPSRIRPSGRRFPRAAIWLTSRVHCSFTTARPTRACRLNSRKPCTSRRRRPSCRSRSSTTSIPATTTISRRASMPPCSDRSHSSIST